jgi:LAS superfamily LD-carboxypeptidase LdcB
MALFQSQAVAGAMRAVAASMAAAASSISKSAVAQTELNGILVFAGKVDADDVEAKEFFALKRKFRLQKARADVETLSLVASAATFPSTGGKSAASNENNDVNNNNKSSNNDNNIPDNNDDDEDCVSPL